MLVQRGREICSRNFNAEQAEITVANGAGSSAGQASPSSQEQSGTTTPGSQQQQQSLHPEKLEDLKVTGTTISGLKPLHKAEDYDDWVTHNVATLDIIGGGDVLEIYQKLGSVPTTLRPAWFNKQRQMVRLLETTFSKLNKGLFIPKLSTVQDILDEAAKRYKRTGLSALGTRCESRLGRCPRQGIRQHFVLRT